VLIVYQYVGLGKLDHRKSFRNLVEDGKTAAKPPFFHPSPPKKRCALVELAETKTVTPTDYKYNTNQKWKSIEDQAAQPAYLAARKK
jgi:hypothetical protein